MANIEHLFVLVMENRSFDHFFGLSGIAGIEPPPPAFGFAAGAEDRLSTDPEHEYGDVQSQISGEPPMSGFGKTPASGAAMRGFLPEQLPVVSTLAREYLLFDNWFSSMPGPTWPNRFFLHAASSGGLANSPSDLNSLLAVEIDSLGFEFENGTLFDRIAASGRKWRVYHADGFPQVLAIKGLVDRFLRNDEFRRIRPGDDDPFAADLADGYDIAYTFIEPDYGLLSRNFSAGNSQHPVGSISAGERFIQYVYETIRNSPVWRSSALLVTWDEHGGFFDRLYPPKAPPPGDAPLNAKRAAVPSEFGFDRFGVRVPALLVSPWVPRGALGSTLFAQHAAAGAHFDHASLISSAREMFGLGGPLTQRDAAAPSWSRAFQRVMRSGADDGPARLPQPDAASESAHATPPAAGPAAQASVSESQTSGFMLIARAVQLLMEREAPTSAQADRALGVSAAPAGGAEVPMNAAAKLAYISDVARRASERTRR